MKKLTCYEWIVLALCAAFLLYCAAWLFLRDTDAPGWQIETEHPAISSPAPSQPDTPDDDGLLPGEVIDLNTASRSDLLRLAQIGPAKADAILAHRQECGPFQTVDELLNVSGIGPTLLEALRPYLSAG